MSEQKESKTLNEKQEKLHNLDLKVHIDRWSELSGSNPSYVYCLTPEEGLQEKNKIFQTTLIDPDLESNATLISTLHDVFAGERDLPFEEILNYKRERVSYKFSIVNLLKVLSRNTPMTGWGTLDEMIADKGRSIPNK